MQGPTDETLMASFQDGQNGAFRVLFEAYWPRVLGLLRHRVGCAAEDLTAETFARAIRGRHTFTPTVSFRAWLYRIAHNLAVDYLRHESGGPLRVVRLDDPAGPASAADDPVELAAAHELAEAYELALRSLPDHQRDSFELVESHALAYDEAAAGLDLPVGTVKSHVHRARDRLRHLLSRFVEE